jgi:DNA modification methylase
MLTVQQLQQTLEKSDFLDGSKSEVETFELDSGRSVPVFSNEFWTSGQRLSHSLHEVSYRACFKSQLPGFFIDRLTKPGNRVFDPFMGRGTTLLEAAIKSRKICGCDVNPLSLRLLLPRLLPPSLDAIEARLESLFKIPKPEETVPSDLEPFYHVDTYLEILHLKNQLSPYRCDPVDDWIRMVATTRLSGHSSGFFSVYSLPPNQAVAPNRQRIINDKRGQCPKYRAVIPRILKKSKTLLKDCGILTRERLKAAYQDAIFSSCSADELQWVPPCSVDLVVTSPPFLNIVDYATDNWLRIWFNQLNESDIPIWQCAKLADWSAKMEKVLRALFRILQPGGWVAFEVGEVHKGEVLLEQSIANLAQKCGFTIAAIMINQQDFTKTAACWGVSNSKKGTNSNRIVLLLKP